MYELEEALDALENVRYHLTEAMAELDRETCIFAGLSFARKDFTGCIDELGKAIDELSEQLNEYYAEELRDMNREYERSRI